MNHSRSVVVKLWSGDHRGSVTSTVGIHRYCKGVLKIYRIWLVTEMQIHISSYKYTQKFSLNSNPLPKFCLNENWISHLAGQRKHVMGKKREWTQTLNFLSIFSCSFEHSLVSSSQVHVWCKTPSRSPPPKWGLVNFRLSLHLHG